MSYKKMKPEHKATWLAALRSGKYVQAQGSLRRKVGRRNGYCCLGVLCEATEQGVYTRVRQGFYFVNIAPELSKYPVRKGNPNVDYYDEAWEDEDTEASLNPELMDYFGISRKAQEKLIHMNDDENKSFEQIADWVEKNL